MLETADGESLDAAFDRRMERLDKEAWSAIAEARRWEVRFILSALIAVLLLGAALILRAGDVPDYQWLMAFVAALLTAIAGACCGVFCSDAEKRGGRAFTEMQVLLAWAGRKGIA